MIWTSLLKGCVHSGLEQYSKAPEKRMLTGKAQGNYPSYLGRYIVLKKHLLDKWYNTTSGTFC